MFLNDQIEFTWGLSPGGYIRGRISGGLYPGAYNRGVISGGVQAE